MIVCVYRRDKCIEGGRDGGREKKGKWREGETEGGKDRMHGERGVNPKP